MPAWSPDVSLDLEIARRLIQRGFPEFELTSLRLIGEGFDNQAYLANETIVFRIPHRQMGGELMRNECLVLAHLNRFELPLAIPNPIYLAEPDGAFPYPFAGYALLEGATSDTVLWTEPTRAACAEALGRFLCVLHQIPADVPFAPSDTLRRADTQFRLQKIVGRMESAPPRFGPLAEELASTPSWNQPGVWVHGDLYARHLVVDSNQNLRGVIDWGDTHVGDPALDLAIAWMFLPPDSWDRFRNAYGGVDDNTWRRAQFRAMTHWVYIAEYAAAREDENLKRECEFVLRNVLGV